MKVLGIDPGMLRMGYGVIEESDQRLAMLDCGTFTALAHTPVAERLHELYLGVKEIIGRYQPEEVAIEEPFVARNARSALAVGRAQAAAMLAAAEQGIPVCCYAPTQVKQSVTDYGGSGKEQVQEMVRIQLGLDQTPQPSDAADALAVALCHLQQTHLARLLGEHR